MLRCLSHTNEKKIKFQVPLRFELPPSLGSPLPCRVYTKTYFDTPEGRLHRFGITLARRVERSKNSWHAIIPNLNTYRELEFSTSSIRLDPGIKSLFRAFFRNNDPIQLGKLRIEQSGRRVQGHDKPIVDVKRDIVIFLDGRRVVRKFNELEVELLEGVKSELNQVRKKLRDAGAREIRFRPKIFEALDLSFPSFPVSLDSSATDLEHLQAMLHSHFSHMMIHDPGTRLGEDPEDLHQMRVATRRIRALLRAGRPLLDPDWTKNMREEMGWVGRLLGGVRDFDVLLDGLLHEASSLKTSEQKAFQPILQKIQKQRSVATAELLNGLQSDRYLALLDHLENSLSSLPSRTSSVTLPDLARKEYNKLKHRVSRLNWNDLSPQLHDVRIQLKRVRYTTELAQSLMGKSVSGFIKQARQLQDLLGSHQDSIIAEMRLAELLKASRSARLAFASGLIVSRLRKQRSVVVGAFPKQWKKLQKRAKDLE